MKPLKFKTDPTHAHQDVVNEIGAAYQDMDPAQRDKLRYDILDALKNKVANLEIADNQEVTVEISQAGFSIR